MSEPTAAHWRVAAATLNYGADEQVSPMDAEYVEAIAAALAAERAKALEPFVALTEEIAALHEGAKADARESKEIGGAIRNQYIGLAWGLGDALTRIRAALDPT